MGLNGSNWRHQTLRDSIQATNSRVITIIQTQYNINIIQTNIIMGNYSSDRSKQQFEEEEGSNTMKIKVATLSVGTCSSPFQFYENEDMEQSDDKKMNETFKRISKRYRFLYSVENSSVLAMISKKMRKRYSPLFNQQAGIIKNFLITKREFIQEWNRVFEEVCTKQYKKIFKHYNKQVIKQKLMNFDLICYHAILAHVYGIDGLDHITDKERSYPYIEFMRKKFNKPLLDTKKRVQKIIVFLKQQKIDVMFLQEVTNTCLQHLETYCVSHRICRARNNGSVDCAILISKDLVSSVDIKNRNLTLIGHNLLFIDSNKSVDQFEAPRAKSPKRKNQKKMFEPETLLQTEKKKVFEKLPPLNISHFQHGEKRDNGFGLNSIVDKQVFIGACQSQEQHQQQFPSPQTRSPSKVSQEDQNHKTNILGSNPSDQSLIQRDHSNMFLPQSKAKKNTSILLGQSSIDHYAKSIVSKLSQADVNDLNFDEDTVIQFMGNIIMISTCLSGDQTAIKELIGQLRRGIEKIQRIYPLHTIIMGVTIESQLNSTFSSVIDLRRHLHNIRICPALDIQIPKNNTTISSASKNRKNLKSADVEAISGILKMKVIPNEQFLKTILKASKVYTVRNKKTNFQLECGMAEKLKLSCQDFIITNRHNFNSQVIDINGTQAQDEGLFIPNIEHPFDHFVVVTQIEHSIHQLIHNMMRIQFDQ